MKFSFSFLTLAIGATLLLTSCNDSEFKQCESLINDENKKPLAFDFCEKAAKSGNSQGQALFAKLLVEKQEYSKAVEFLEKSANQKNPLALFTLGEIYEKGLGKEQNIKTAQFYYQESCNAGEIKGCERVNHFKQQQQAEELAKLEQAEKEKRMAEEKRQAMKDENDRLAAEKVVLEKQLEQQKALEVERKRLAEEKAQAELTLAQERAKLERQKLEMSGNTQSATSNSSPSFAYIGQFYEGIAAVKSDNGLWGFIDKNSNIVVPMIYTCVGRFSEGLAGVYYANGVAGECVGGKWGYIDKTGYISLPLVFDDATRFEKDKKGVVKAKVTYQGNIGYIDRYGNWLQ